MSRESGGKRAHSKTLREVLNRGRYSVFGELRRAAAGLRHSRSPTVSDDGYESMTDGGHTTNWPSFDYTFLWINF